MTKKTKSLGLFPEGPNNPWYTGEPSLLICDP